MGQDIKNIDRIYESSSVQSEESKRALRHGPYLMLYLLSKILPRSNITITEINRTIKQILSKWIEFEKFMIQRGSNQIFFKEIFDRVLENQIKKFNYKKYYRSENAIEDLKLFFLKINPI